jgi:hypothetical protein
MLSEHNKLRHVVISPYAKDMGPRFRLIIWDAGVTQDGRNLVGYRLSEVGGEVLFTGEDFSPSPHIAIDADEVIACLVGFLTLKPGDTDPDYFAKYTQAQLDFAHAHGDALMLEATERFGDETWRE